ncbi:MAG: hypothetical protein E6R08_00790 [Nevskiaceae bacterium]|nr:MAG: hypothetical protein E6R08_00790 [Nevskiaceae bacterium]
MVATNVIDRVEVGKEVDRTELGRELGFEMARLGLRLDADAPKELLEGFREAIHTGQQGRKSSKPFERKLLRLKISAWKRNRVVDDGVTAEFLERIAATHCPITREQMTSGTDSGTDMTMDRVFNEGAYAVGNIACMSARANHAKGALLPLEILSVAHTGEDRDGLTNEEWWRLACLACMATPPGYARTSTPMLVYPPVGLMLSNGYVVVQMAMSLIGAGKIGERAIGELRNTVKGKRAKKAFSELRQIIWIATSRELRSCATEQAQRFAMCDAWLNPLVTDAFVALLKSTEDHALLIAGARKCTASVSEYRGLNELVGAWALDTGGYA